MQFPGFLTVACFILSEHSNGHRLSHFPLSRSCIVSLTIT